MRETIKAYMRLAQEMRDNYLDGCAVAELTRVNAPAVTRLTAPRIA